MPLIDIDGNINDKDLDNNFDFLLSEINNLKSTVSDLNLNKADKLEIVRQIDLVASNIVNDTAGVSGYAVSNALLGLKNRIDNIIAQSGTSDTEVVDARFDSVFNTTYTVLTNRLDAMSQYAKDIKTEVTDARTDTVYGTTDANLSDRLNTMSQRELDNSERAVYTIRDVTNTNDYVGNITGLTLFDDLRLDLEVTNPNTGSATLDIGDGGGAKSIKFINSQGDKVDLPSGELFGVNALKYDGVDWVLVEKSFKEIINIKELGAKGDYNGTTGTDNTTIMQGAIDSLTNGGIILIPKGNYLISDSLYMKSNIKIKGVGFASKVTMQDNSNRSAFRMEAVSGVNKLENCTIEDLYLYQNISGTIIEEKNYAGISITAEQINPSSNPDTTNHTGETFNLNIQNVLIEGFGCGLYLGRNTFVEQSYNYNNLSIINCKYGVFLDDFCEYTTITDSIIQKCEYGFYDNGSSNCQITDNNINNCTEAGIKLHTTGRNTSKKLIASNVLNHNKRGLWVADGVGTVGIRHSICTIENNHFLANTAQGIVALGLLDSIISGNIFSSNVGEIFIGTGCERLSIQSNKFDKGASGSYAIHIELPGISDASSYRYHKLDGNTFKGYLDSERYEVNQLGTTSLDTNNCIIDNTFEYWNTAGLPPSDTAAANSKANVDYTFLPNGCLCINNATSDGSEVWLLIRKPTSSGVTEVTFSRIV